MPFLSTKALRTSSRLVMVVSIWVIFTSGNVCAFSLLDFVPSEGSFALGTLSGKLVGTYDWLDQRQTLTGGGSSDNVRTRFQEDLSVANSGSYILDPRLIEGSSGCDLGLFQEIDKFSGSNKYEDGTLISWDTNYTFFGDFPYTAILFSHRSQADTTTDFGGTTDSTNQNFGLLAMIRQDSFLREALPYFSGDAYAREEESDETTTQLGQTVKIDDTRDVVGVDADKGFQTADLDFSYQLVNDTLTGTNRISFSNSWSSLNYSLDFGPDLTRNWSSYLTYLGHSGGGTNESYLYDDERLKIDRFANLTSSYENVLSYTDTQGQSVTTDLATFALEYQLYRNLLTTFTLQGSYVAVSPGGHQDFAAVELSQGYNHSIPWGGTIFLSADGRYEIDQSHVSGPVTVLDEQHTAPSFFGPGLGFTLSSAFVVTSTIVMYDTRGGGRIPTTLGVDYVTVQQGPLTKIVILPTTVVILPGDPLAVNYSYAVAPNGRYSTTSLTASAGVSFGWIALSIAHQQTDQTMQSGVGSQYLYSQHQESGQMTLHHDWEWVAASANALYGIYHTQSQSTGIFDYTLQDYGEHLIFQPEWSTTTINVNGEQTLTDYTDQPKSHTTDLDYEAELERYLPSGDALTAFVRLRQLTETAFPTETDYEAGVRGYFQYGKIFFSPWFTWKDRTYGTTKTESIRVLLRIGRYF